MLVCLRNIDSKVCRILNVIITIGGKSHQIGTTALTFNHVAHSLFVKITLRQHTDNQCTVFNQADGAVLQLACGVGLAVNVGDFLHLETALQADSVVQATTDKENILSVELLGGKPLDTLLILNNLLNLIRKLCQLS